MFHWYIALIWFDYYVWLYYDWNLGVLIAQGKANWYFPLNSRAPSRGSLNEIQSILSFQNTDNLTWLLIYGNWFQKWLLSISIWDVKLSKVHIYQQVHEVSSTRNRNFDIYLTFRYIFIYSLYIHTNLLKFQETCSKGTNSRKFQ